MGHPVNAPSPMLVTVVGIVMLVSALQPRNASVSILVIPSGMIKLVREEQSQNPPLPMLVTGLPLYVSGKDTDAGRFLLSFTLISYVSFGSSVYVKYSPGAFVGDVPVSHAQSTSAHRHAKRSRNNAFLTVCFLILIFSIDKRICHPCLFTVCPWLYAGDR